jgi:O-antigen ligase
MTTFPGHLSGSPRSNVGLTPFWALTFLFLHVPLGLAMRASPAVSTIHAIFVFALGLGWALAGYENRLAVWGGYAAVSDVLWRMTDASVPWEFAKYTLVLILTLAILRSGRLRGPVLPFIYMGLLIPSSLLVVWLLGPEAAFNGISFNLSGPLALGVAAWFFSRLALTTSEYATLLIAMIGPILSVGSVALSGILSGEAFRFIRASNLATSGGFGPNQVSSVLGLGALLSLFLLLTTRRARWFKAILFSLMLGLACQSALTFSRGGLYTAAGALAVAVPFVVQDRGARWRLFIGGTVALGLAVFLVLPGLERFTGGALAARFEDTGTTGRDLIAKADFAIWSENPILGVGAGMGPASRLAILGHAPAAHTEWSRLVAEHGLLGLGAAVCLIAMAWRACARDRRPFERALAAGFATWAFLFMFHAGMRLAAPAFAVGLAQCRIRASTVQPEERRV